MAYESERSLILKGISMGLIHVLAGPDHLSALAALAVGTSYKSFVLGFRWGIGHSTGLIVVAIIFIALKGDLDLRTLGRYCDSLVGVFMISLGCYGVISAIRSFREKRQKRDVDVDYSPHSLYRKRSSTPSKGKPKKKSFKRGDDSSYSSATTAAQQHQQHQNQHHHHHQHAQVSHDTNTSGAVVETAGGTLRRTLSASASMDAVAAVAPVSAAEDEQSLDIDERSELISPRKTEKIPSFDIESVSIDEGYGEPGTPKASKKAVSWWALLCDDHHHHHPHSQGQHVEYAVEECSYCPFINMQDPSTQRILSFAIGLLHGVAGPGGILGVLPAVEMQKWTSSVLYLGSFIIASTLSMGTFAAMYGEGTRRLGATTEMMELGLSVFSSGMSIVVGVIWFVFSVLGKLDEFFE